VECLPEVRLKARPLIGSLGGGDHQLIREPTNGTWRSTPCQPSIHHSPITSHKTKPGCYQAISQ